MRIRLLVTGGTFDKEYNEIAGDFLLNSTHAPEILENGKCTLEVFITELMMIDSGDMNDEHREAIFKECARADEDKIVITHGTDGMAETARYLSERKPDVSVVLTGAIIPYGFSISDCSFNLGAALAFVQIIPPGVYVVMNGRIFRGDNVRKNLETGKFQKITHDGETRIIT